MFESASSSSPLNRLIPIKDVKITDERRKLALDNFFRNTTVPPYNLDDFVRLFWACQTQAKKIGQTTWTTYQTKIMNHIEYMCSTTQVDAGNFSIFIDAIESQLRMLYVTIDRNNIDS
jgi:hypothetical protein